MPLCTLFGDWEAFHGSLQLFSLKVLFFKLDHKSLSFTAALVTFITHNVLGKESQLSFPGYGMEN